MTQPDAPAPPRSRDRDATERLILDAARAVLAEGGFATFGVNAVARRAGCDKQLVYRYFGGLDGLVDAIGASLASWVEDRLLPAGEPPASYGALIEGLALGYLEALRADALMQKIVAWELSDASPQVRRLSDVRSRALMQWMMRARGALVPPEGCDAPALNAVVIGAVQHLVLAGATAGRFSGLALAGDADWQRVRGAISRIVRAVYGG